MTSGWDAEQVAPKNVDDKKNKDITTLHVGVILPHILHRGAHRCYSSDESGRTNLTSQMFFFFFKGALKLERQENILHADSTRKQKELFVDWASNLVKLKQSRQKAD